MPKPLPLPVRPTPPVSPPSVVRVRTQPRTRELQNYGHLIRLLRLNGKDAGVERQWTRATLAEKVGISTSHLARLERGAAEPGIMLAWRLADALHLPLDAMLVMARDGAFGDIRPLVEDEHPVTRGRPEPVEEGRAT